MDFSSRAQLFATWNDAKSALANGNAPLSKEFHQFIINYIQNQQQKHN